MWSWISETSQACTFPSPSGFLWTKFRVEPVASTFEVFFMCSPNKHRDECSLWFLVNFPLVLQCRFKKKNYCKLKPIYRRTPRTKIQFSELFIRHILPFMNRTDFCQTLQKPFHGPVPPKDSLSSTFVITTSLHFLTVCSSNWHPHMLLLRFTHQKNKLLFFHKSLSSHITLPILQFP